MRELVDWAEVERSGYQGVELGWVLEDACEHVPGRFQRSRRVDFDASVSAAARAGLAAIERVITGELAGGILSGPSGSGKSFLAAIACVELSLPLAAESARRLQAVSDADDRERAGYQVKWERWLENQYAPRCPRWLNVPVTLEALRRDFDRSDGHHPGQDDFEDDAAGSGLLVLDDLGAEKASEWTADVLYRLVSERYDAGLRTLATSNYTAAQLSRRPGYGRIVSRLAEDGMVLELASAKDYRLTHKRKRVTA